MNADRELLELAAKAAGYKPDGLFGRGLLVVVNAYTPEQKAFSFDPLNDDGDALRLGAAIEMELEINKGHVYCRANHGCREGFSEFDKEDTLRAMRRAIVRTAAAIGKAMP